MDLSKEVVCFSGRIPGLTRAQAQAAVLAAGGTISSSVTLTTTLLVVGTYADRKTHLKFLRAQKLIAAGQNLRICNAAEFLAKLTNVDHQLTIW